MPILCGSRRQADRRIEEKKARDQQYSRARVSKARRTMRILIALALPRQFRIIYFLTESAFFSPYSWG